MARREGSGFTSHLKKDIEKENLAAGAMSLWGVYEKGLRGEVTGLGKEYDEFREREGVDGDGRLDEDMVD